MDIAAVEAVIRPRFDQCEVLEEGIFRCERRYRGNPWSITFIDASGKIPSSSAELESYLDEKVAKSYFSSTPRDLRWNHYLIFLQDSPAATTKELIEANVDYARKYVVATDSLSELLRAYTLPGDTVQPSEDVFSRWSATLESAGLGSIVADNPKATLVRDYVNGAIAEGPMPPRVVSARLHEEDAVYSRFLESLTIRSFLLKPRPQTYRFAGVNLIFGPNGAGKTSLLEAIEHFYCGSTLRNEQEAVWGADVEARFVGHEPVIHMETSTDAFRARDLRWYGRTYDYKNRLSEAFNRYNFFNSDAAYRFAYEPNNKLDLNDALSRIALGDAANRLWDRIAKSLDLFETQRRELERESARVRESLSSARRELELLGGPSTILGDLFVRLQDRLARAKWKSVPSALSDFNADMRQKLRDVTESVSTIAQAVWLGGTLTYAVIAKKRDDAADALSKAESLLSSIASAREELARLDTNLRQVARRRDDLVRHKAYIDVGFEQLVSREVAIRSAMPAAAVAGWARTLSEEPIVVADTETPVQDLLLLGESELVEADESLRREEGNLLALQAAASSMSAAFAQIRALAVQICAEDSTITKCPVCRTAFESQADLLSHISQPDSDVASASIRESRTRADELKKQRDQVQQYVDHLRLCGRFLDRIGRSPTATNMVDTLAEARKVLTEVSRLESESREVNTALKRLYDDGYSQDELRTLRRATQTTASDNETSDISALGSSIQENEAEFAHLDTLVGEQRSRLETALDEWRALSQAWATQEAEDDVLAELSSKASKLAMVAGQIEAAREHVVIEDGADLNELLLALQIASDAADAVAVEIDSMASRQTRVTSLEQHALEDQRDMELLTDKLKRCNDAVETLMRIKRDDGRDKALSGFLSSHRDAISQVLRRIHAPREFSGISPSGRQVVTLDGKSERRFHEVSSGQRAAIALSVFLTLNNMLRRGPPLLMFDDPVTSVDDINVLAFLDHLRDVAMTEQRQIFFATANEQIASLFKKKFSFLGKEGFQEIPLGGGFGIAA